MASSKGLGRPGEMVESGFSNYVNIDLHISPG